MFLFVFSLRCVPSKASDHGQSNVDHMLNSLGVYGPGCPNEHTIGVSVNKFEKEGGRGGRGATLEDRKQRGGCVGKDGGLER